MKSADVYLQHAVIAASLVLIILSILLTACVSVSYRASLNANSASGFVPAEVEPTRPPRRLTSEAESLPPTPVPLVADIVSPLAAATDFPQTAYVPTVDVDQIMSSPDYGMQAFLYWQAEVADRDAKLIQDAGFRWVKQEIAWREIEGGGKGRWRWNITDRVIDQIEAHNLKVIVRLGVQPEWAAPEVPFPEIGPPADLQDFYDYVYAVASRYKGRVEAYQVWNEPNLSREWGGRPPNPAEYVAMLKAGYQAVKAADPNAIVISAGLAPTTQNNELAMPDIHFIQGMYDAGAAAYFDALGVHAAGYKSPPEMDPQLIATTPELNNNDSGPVELRRVYGFRHVEDVRELMVANGDAVKKIVILEFGWTVDPRPDSPYHWHAVTPEEQDKYLQRAFAYAAQNWQPWIGVMNVIYIANPEWTAADEQTYWSVVYPGYPELNTAPAYYGLLTMAKVPPVEATTE